MNDVCAIVKRRLRLIRLAREMTMREVAASLGVTDNAVSSYENSEKDIRLGTVVRLLSLYKVHPSDFFSGIDFPVKQEHVRKFSHFLGDLNVERAS